MHRRGFLSFLTGVAAAPVAVAAAKTEALPKAHPITGGITWVGMDDEPDHGCIQNVLPNEARQYREDYVAQFDEAMDARLCRDESGRFI